MKPEILGIEIGIETEKEIFRFVRKALNENKQKYIVTLNSEIILKAEDDENYRVILNQADLRLIDGFGIKLVGWLKRLKTGERLAGADLAEYILKVAKEKKCSMGVVISRDGLSSREEVEKLFKDYENIKVLEVDVEKSFCFSENYNFDVLLVGLGASWQEKFIWQAKRDRVFNKLAIGCGGTIDFLTGRQKRAPKWMREIGMEWLWRLITQPNRFFRIWNATVVFLWKGLMEK